MHFFESFAPYGRKSKLLYGLFILFVFFVIFVICMFFLIITDYIIPFILILLKYNIRKYYRTLNFFKKRIILIFFGTLCAIIIIDLIFYISIFFIGVPNFIVLKITLIDPDLISAAYDLSDTRFTDAVHNRCKYCSQNENLITSYNKLKEYYISEYQKRNMLSYYSMQSYEEEENLKKLFDEFSKKK